MAWVILIEIKMIKTDKQNGRTLGYILYEYKGWFSSFSALKIRGHSL